MSRFLMCAVLFSCFSLGACSTVSSVSSSETAKNVKASISCRAINNWVSVLPELYPNTQFKRMYDKDADKVFRPLFQDHHFKKYFGKSFSELSDSELKKFMRAVPKCDKPKNLNVGIFLKYPFFKRSPSLSYPLSYYSFVEYSNSTRNIQNFDEITPKKQVATNIQTVNENRPTLSGEYQGATRCAGNLHNATVKIGPRKPDGTYEGTLSLDEINREMQNIPLRIQEESKGRIRISGSTLGRSYRKGGRSINAAYFIKGSRNEIQTSQNGGYQSIYLDTQKLCNPIRLAKFNPVPEIKKANPDRDYSPGNVCWDIYQWLKHSFSYYNSALSMKNQYPRVLNNYDPSDVFYYSLAYHRFQWSFHVPLSRLSDDSIDMFLDQNNFCETNSDRNEQIKRVVAKLPGQWSNTSNNIPRNRELLKSFDKNARTSSSDFEAFLKEVASTPENIETLATVENMLTRFTNEFAVLPPQQFNDYLEALAERVNAQKLMIHLMNEAGLTVPPKLAIISDRGEEITPDDAKLKSWDNDKYINMSKPLVL